jgi:hypothetical protein
MIDLALKMIVNCAATHSLLVVRRASKLNLNYTLDDSSYEKGLCIHKIPHS